MAMRRGHALDLGCGTGQLSVLLAGEFDRVTATDPSASQIASAGARDNIRYAIGSAEAIDLPPASVDLITYLGVRAQGGTMQAPAIKR